MRAPPRPALPHARACARSGARPDAFARRRGGRSDFAVSTLARFKSRLANLLWVYRDWPEHAQRRAGDAAAPDGAMLGAAPAENARALVAENGFALLQARRPAAPPPRRPATPPPRRPAAPPPRPCRRRAAAGAHAHAGRRDRS